MLNTTINAEMYFLRSWLGGSREKSVSASNKQSKPSDHSFGYAAIELKLTSGSNQSYYLANHRLLRYMQRLPNAKNSCHWMKMNMARYSILNSFQNNLCRLPRKLTFQKDILPWMNETTRAGLSQSLLKWRQLWDKVYRRSERPQHQRLLPI